MRCGLRCTFCYIPDFSFFTPFALIKISCPSEMRDFSLKSFRSTGMNNIITPEVATASVESIVADVDLNSTALSAEESGVSVKVETINVGSTQGTVLLDSNVNHKPAGYSFRGELFLSLPELESARECLEGSGFAFEEVKTPPASPQAELSFAATVSALRRSRESSGSTADGASEKSPVMRSCTMGKRKRVVNGG